MVLHDKLLLMEQQPVVFAGTYRDNLLVGAENLPFDDEEKMQQELQTACVKAATYAHAKAPTSGSL